MNVGDKKANIYKILLLGDSMVGKTSFLNRFNGNAFKRNMISTIGCDYISKEMQLDDKENRVIELWDTAGQEKFLALTKNMFKGADGVLVFYDIADKKTYLSITRWINDIRKTAPANVQMTVVGNKTDLESQRQVDYEQGEIIAKENKASFIETSCLTNSNIQEAVQQLGKFILNERSKGPEEEAQKNHQNSVKLTKKKHNKKKKDCCKQSS